MSFSFRFVCWYSTVLCRQQTPNTLSGRPFTRPLRHLQMHITKDENPNQTFVKTPTVPKHTDHFLCPFLKPNSIAAIITVNGESPFCSPYYLNKRDDRKIRGISGKPSIPNSKGPAFYLRSLSSPLSAKERAKQRKKPIANNKKSVRQFCLHDMLQQLSF